MDGEGGEETGWGRSTDSVPLRRRMRNCSGERMARHSSSLLCLSLFPDAIAAARGERGTEWGQGVRVAMRWPVRLEVATAMVFAEATRGFVSRNKSNNMFCYGGSIM